MDPVRYHVALADPHAHLFRVSATFPGPFPGGVMEAFFPTWTPGSYLQREFARNVVAASAKDEKGAALALAKKDKATWRVEAGRAAAVTLELDVYANDLTVRTSHLDGTHAYFNGANLFPLRTETRDAPCLLTIDAPAAWKIATTLPREGKGFRASDYDHLADCPVEIGTHRTLSFTAAGVPHEIALWGDGNFDEKALAADLAKIVEAQAKLMGGLPFQRYLFIVHLTDKGRGGLEHRDSTTLLYPRFGFRPRKEYEEFLRLASHEYFHAWNVKRLKPKAFDPYDYTRENYTSLLWAMEGFTEYYEVMSVARAGLISRERLLAIWGEEITALLRTPGRKVQSLAESSFDSWIKYYRQDENSPNSGVSYYRKGALVALALDMELRARTKNAKSLDDLMRVMFERHGKPGQGAPEDAYAKVLAELGGAEMAALLARYVETTAEIDFATHLAHAGLSFRTRVADAHDDKGGSAGKRAKKKEGEPEEPAAPWLGLDARAAGGRTQVTHVVRDSPAEKAGIYAGDEIVAVDGWRADEKAWRTRLTEHAPGDVVEVTVFRRDRLIPLRVTLAAPPADTAWIETKADPSPAAKAILASWAG
ncbi:MAG TPA: PDZ domain-containing protein [bacterium]|nr:PDZ domain-containing protein [bacterium]